MCKPTEQDSLDLFESSLPSLFEQPVIAYSSSSSSDTFVHDHPLLPFPIRIGFPNPPARLNNLQAQYLWPSGMYLSHLILTGGVDLEGKGKEKARVLELGAGTGLPGITALVSIALNLKQTEEKGQAPGKQTLPSTSTTIATEDPELSEELGTVVATDFGDPDICDVLRENYHLALDTLISNSYSRSQSQIRSQSQPKLTGKVDWQVLGFEWGTDPTLLLSAPSGQNPRKYTTILLSDTLFNTSSHRSLLQSIQSLLEPDRGKAYLTAGFHGGSRGTVDRFVNLVRNEGCQIEECHVVKWDPRAESWIDVGKKEEGEYGEGVVWSGILTLSVPP